jgi:hypothetical protein
MREKKHEKIQIIFYMMYHIWCQDFVCKFHCCRKNYLIHKVKKNSTKERKRKKKVELMAKIFTCTMNLFELIGF